METEKEELTEDIGERGNNYRTDPVSRENLKVLDCEGVLSGFGQLAGQREPQLRQFSLQLDWPVGVSEQHFLVND